MRNITRNSQTPAEMVVCAAVSPKQCIEQILSYLHVDSKDHHHSRNDQPPSSGCPGASGFSLCQPSSCSIRSHDTSATTLMNVRNSVRQLTISYVDGDISPYDPAISLTFPCSDNTGSGTLAKMFRSEFASTCNVWQLGILVAKILIAVLEQERDNGSLAQATYETEIETYLMVLLAIALQPHMADAVVMRVINQPLLGVIEVDSLVLRAQKVLLARMHTTHPHTNSTSTSNSKSSSRRSSTIPDSLDLDLKSMSAPPSPYPERTSFFVPDTRHRRRGMSRSSTFSAPLPLTSMTMKGVQSKAAVASAVTSGEFSPPLGSFVPIPTRSASSSLQHTVSAALSTKSIMHNSGSSSNSNVPRSRHRGRSPFTWLASSKSHHSRTSSPVSSHRSPSVDSVSSSVPSISRTSSPISTTDSISTAGTSVRSTSPSPASVTVNLKVPVPPAGKPKLQERKRRDSSVLAAVEDTSRLRTNCQCAACGVGGSNFPKCPKCCETWCSRQCRVKSNGGKRHVCAKSAVAL